MCLFLVRSCEKGRSRVRLSIYHCIAFDMRGFDEFGRCSWCVLGEAWGRWCLQEGQVHFNLWAWPPLPKGVEAYIWLLQLAWCIDFWWLKKTSWCTTHKKQCPVRKNVSQWKDPVALWKWLYVPCQPASDFIRYNHVQSRPNLRIGRRGGRPSALLLHVATKCFVFSLSDQTIPQYI